MPRPPYSSGTIQPSSPSSPALRQASRLTTPASSHSAVCGTHSFSRNARTICRNCSCSSVKMVRRTGSSSGSAAGLALRSAPDAGPRALAGTERIKMDYITILAVLPDREPAETEEDQAALMSDGVRAAMAAMTGSRPGRAVMTRTMASSSPALSRAKAAGAGAAGP